MEYIAEDKYRVVTVDAMSDQTLNLIDEYIATHAHYTGKEWIVYIPLTDVGTIIHYRKLNSSKH
jgi:hypothetical protein